jgi:hypothetical protein
MLAVGAFKSADSCTDGELSMVAELALVLALQILVSASSARSAD